MVESFLEYIEYEKRYSPHTLTSYRNDLSQFAHFLASTSRHSPPEATFTDVRGWLVSLTKEGVEASTISRKMACLRSYYKYLLREEVIRDNPMQKIKSPRVKKRQPVFVQEANMLHLLDKFTFPEGFAGLRDKLIVEMLYGTGIRLSELLGLQETDVQLPSQTIKVLGKRRKQRLVPLHATLIALLETYSTAKRTAFEGKADPHLVVTDQGEGAYPMFIYRTVRKYLDQITTIEKRSPHVLRHTFATHLMSKGADLNAVKDLLGHANLAATQVYTHHSLERMQEIFRQAHPKAKQ